MYLSFETYADMGGSLEKPAFTAAERKAEYLIDSQAGGKTGERLKSFATLPQAVSDCVFELIGLLNGRNEKTVTSESQTLGGQSESVSYAVLTKEQTDEEIAEVLHTYLYPIKCGGVSILYRGNERAL